MRSFHRRLPLAATTATEMLLRFSSVCLTNPEIFLPIHVTFLLLLDSVFRVFFLNVRGFLLTSARFLDFPVLIPSMMEQEVIIRLLDSSLEKEQQTKNIAESVLDQIDLMKKSILARAFRGELGTNDPSEESAVELLKRTIL